MTAAEAELTEIDSKFGDADHGLTMTKIAGAISAAVDDAEGGIQTMMDALIPASEAIAAYEGDSADELFAAAAKAATEGAENSKNFVSKFGRAKSYGAKTIGTPDAGATSMARFFQGLAQA
ncbi:MAG: DAK2 domain-containing protein [Dysosmobacter sp.]|nr:DAK2 domain-containing protein [Dysosmobacter sp.]